MYLNLPSDDVLFIQRYLQEIINSFSILKFVDKVGSRCQKRDAYLKVFQELKNISEKDRLRIVSKMEKLSTIEIKTYNYAELGKEFQELFKSKEFEKIRKLIECIPKNQQKKFLNQMLIDIDNKIIGVRNYLDKTIPVSSDQKSAILLDQAFYQMHLIGELLRKEMTSTNISETKLSNLMAYLLILTIKITGYLKEKINADEVYRTIAFIDSQIKIEDRKQYADYLIALTN